MGFTDIAKAAAGMDHEIAKSAYDRDGFAAKIERFRPRAVAFTSKTVPVRRGIWSLVGRAVASVGEFIAIDIRSEVSRQPGFPILMSCLPPPPRCTVRR